MSKLTLGFLAAGALGLAALATPAAALPLHAPNPAIHAGHASHSAVTPIQARRHHRRCTVKNVVERRHGRRIVKRVRVCR